MPKQNKQDKPGKPYNSSPFSRPSSPAPDPKIAALQRATDKAREVNEAQRQAEQNTLARFGTHSYTFRVPVHPSPISHAQTSHANASGSVSTHRDETHAEDLPRNVYRSSSMASINGVETDAASTTGICEGVIGGDYILLGREPLSQHNGTVETLVPEPVVPEDEPIDFPIKQQPIITSVMDSNDVPVLFTGLLGNIFQFFHFNYWRFGDGSTLHRPAIQSFPSVVQQLNTLGNPTPLQEAAGTSFVPLVGPAPLGRYTNTYLNSIINELSSESDDDESDGKDSKDGEDSKDGDTKDPFLPVNFPGVHRNYKK